MPFKAEELMIQVLPREVEDPGKTGFFVGCVTKDTYDPDVCEPPSQPDPCEPVTDTNCQNDTLRTKGGFGSAGLDLLRRQMKERLSQELPS